MTMRSITSQDDLALAREAARYCVDNAHHLAIEECARLRAAGLDIATVCEAIGRQPVHGWDRLAWALAAELRKAWFKLGAADRFAA